MSVDLFSVKPWPHQEYGVTECIKHIKPGNWVVLQSPTGGGKSKMMEAIARYGVQKGMGVDIKVHRKLLLDQLVGVFDRAGERFGVRAASMKGRLDHDAQVQISSLPTEHSRCTGDDASWDLHKAGIVLVDEAHMQNGPAAIKILERQASEGACIIGVTATPIEMHNNYKTIIIAGTNSELRKCKAHVPAVVKAPFEFDLSKIGREKTGEFRVGDATKSLFSTAIIGRIIEEFKMNNPDMRATLCQCPCVKSSIWMAEEFTNSGVPAASIDGKGVWFDGEYVNDPDGTKRKQVLEMHRAGDVKVVCNRFVLREGIDLPYVYNLILACPIGSLKSYVQVVGRAIRYSAETPDHVLITDHGGNCFRHGSPNANRNWEKLFHMTEEQLFEEAKEREKKTAEDPPITCVICGTVRQSGNKCPDPPIGCGRESGHKGRIIIQKSGKLRRISEHEMRKKTEQKELGAQELWDKFYWACYNSKSEKGMTFKQAAAVFKSKYGFWPPFGLKNTPRYNCDRSKPIREVPRSELI